ncbi:MAG: hypothetical protein QOG53_841 [Frankiales bacterium]|jgi:hypothetical protein|nr:hypothetical protein [Frankiales bacterium]
MRFRSGWPRWARALSSPWLVSPVLVFALLIGAFLGYGAYTRSKPTHYGRGGDVFAAGIPSGDGPSAAPSASTRPSAAASAAAHSPGTTGVSSAVGGTTSSGRNGRPNGEPSSKPTPLTGAPGVVMPATGSYGLSVHGSEHVNFGAFKACNNTFPSSAVLAISKAQGESPTSYNFDLRLFPGSANKHDERHIYRYTKSAVVLDYEQATVTCAGIKQSTTVNFSPAQVRAPLPLHVGSSWTSKGGDSGRTEDASGKVTGTSHLSVGGKSYLVYIIDMTVKMSGSESGSRTQRWWYAPSLGLPLKWHEAETGARSGATYKADYTCQITRLP